MLNITILRHAESVYNKDNIFQGQVDCECSENGINSAKELKKKFKEEDYDLCYCSPLKRARTTAEILIKKLPIYYDDRLKEISLGTFENTKITKEKQHILFTQNSIPEGAESHEELDKRVKSFLNMLKVTYKNKEKILVITHGGTIHSIKRILYINDNKQTKNLDIIKIKI